MAATWIRNAAWVVAWDGAAQAHVYLRDADVVFAGDRLVFVGHGFQDRDGIVTETIDGRERLVMPGLIDIHSHPTGEPLLRGIVEERKSRQFGMSTLYEYIQLVGRSSKTRTLAEVAAGGGDTRVYSDEPARVAAARLAVWEMLKSGTTSFVDYTPIRANWLDDVAGTGIRTWIAPSFRSGTWYTPNGREVMWEWDEAAGERAMREAFDLLDQAVAHPSGRLSALVAPGQIDTCTPALIKAAAAEAERRGVPWTIHAAQAVVEFREIFRRHGMTPIAWLESLGVLGPRLTIGHAIFGDHHSWLNWPDRNDIGRMAKAGVSVAHCPVQFSRGGVLLEDLGRYIEAGINVAIGTDTNPHNMLDEMRWALILCKVSRRDVAATSVAQVFHAATIGAAKALGRDDIGRLTPGSKADLVLVDLTHPALHPLRDPLQTLLFCAQDRAVRDVFVDGRQVVRDFAVTTIDVAATLPDLAAGQERALASVHERDWAKRGADEVFPRSIPVRGHNEWGEAARVKAAE
jgi:5-methylthioadenosine/S-adenosylhomocysteine deaminase